MPPENSYGNFTIPSDIVEFYRSFSYRYLTDRFFNFIDYPDYLFRFKVTKKKIKTLEIE